MKSNMRIINILGVSLASAYTSHSTLPFAVHGRGANAIPTSTVAREQESLSEQRSKSTYSLGLGKNQPLVPTREELTENVYKAVQYLNEHQAVSEYPSPQSVLGQVAAAQEAVATKPPVKGPIVPVRLANDVVGIHTEQSKAPVAFVLSANQLDLNTAWVEMLIHEQQLKFA